MVENPPANAEDLDSIPGPGIYPGEENAKPLQYSCWENPVDKEAWWAAAHGLQIVGHD